MAGSSIVIRIISDASKAKRELKDTGEELDSFGKKLVKVGQVAISGVAIDKLVSFGKAAVDAASSTAESMSKVKVVFGEAADAVVDFADTSAESLGISKRAALEAAGTFGNLFTSMKIGVADSREMSLTLTKLAADLGSFNNVGIDDVFTALRSGLVGEQEPLRRLGINLTEARLKAEAFRLGLADGTSTLDAAVKAQAAYSLILQDSGNAQGDFARTAGGLANQTKILAAQFDDAKAKLGEQLLPIVIDVTHGLVGLLDAIDGGGPKIEALGAAAIIATAAFAPFAAGLAAIAGIAVEFEGNLKRKSDAIAAATVAVQENTAADQVAAKANELLQDEMGRAGVTADQVAAAVIEGGKAWEEMSAALRGMSVEQAKLTPGFNANIKSVEQMGYWLDQAKKKLKESSSAMQTGTERSMGFADSLTGVAKAAVTAAQGVSAYTNSLGRITSSSALSDVQNRLPRFDINITDRIRGVGVQAGEDYLHALADSLSHGGSKLEDPMKELGDYLHALAQKQVDDLNNVYSSIGASISLDSAANSVDDAKERLQSLVDEFNGLPGRIADAEGTVGSLLAAATAITPEEQQTIDQAQAEVDKITKALQGVTDEVNAPASSFAGPSTVSQTSKVAFSLNDLKVAENKLETAKRSAVGPTRELEQAEKDLADLRERYLELPKQIEGAQRSLVNAEAALVEAKRRQVEAGKELLEQGPDAIQQYKDLAAAAGLSADEVNRLVDGMIAAGNAAGLVDVFGNGYLFQPPDQADATRRFVAGLASFDTGGIVGGPKGAAQLVVAHGGETILPTHKGSVATLPPITINAGFGADAQAIANAVRKALLDVQRKNGSLGLN